MVRSQADRVRAKLLRVVRREDRRKARGAARGAARREARVEARRAANERNTEAGCRLDETEIEAFHNLLASGDLELSFSTADGAEVPPLTVHKAILCMASPDVLEPLLCASKNLATLKVEGDDRESWLMALRYLYVSFLPKREFDYRNILKALPVVHKYNLSTLLNEMVEWLTRPSYDDSEDGVEHDVADDTEEDEYENEDEEDYNTYYKAELSSFLGVDEKDPGSYVLTWLLVTEKLQLECLHRICMSFLDKALTNVLKRGEKLQQECVHHVGVSFLKKDLTNVLRLGGDIQSRATVEKWLQLPESDLAIIRPCLVDALMIMRGSDRMFICTEDDSWEVDVVHWAELGHAFNIRDVEDLCLGWLEENMEVVLTGVEEDEAEVMKPTSITRWLRLVEEPTFASLKPICTEWLASNIKTCLTEQNVYSWIKRSQDNKWESVLSAIFTWLADSCKCEGFQVRPSTSTPYTSVVDSLEVPCALSSPVLVQLLQTSSGRWSPGIVKKLREDLAHAQGDRNRVCAQMRNTEQRVEAGLHRLKTERAEHESRLAAHTVQVQSLKRQYEQGMSQQRRNLKSHYEQQIKRLKPL